MSLKQRLCYSSIMVCVFHEERYTPMGQLSAEIGWTSPTHWGFPRVSQCLLWKAFLPKDTLFRYQWNSKRVGMICSEAINYHYHFILWNWHRNAFISFRCIINGMVNVCYLFYKVDTLGLKYLTYTISTSKSDENKQCLWMLLGASVLCFLWDLLRESL